MNSEFQSRLLYTQKSLTNIEEQEPIEVSSTIYAIRFLYPGASQHTTGRIRITCTYRDADQFESHSGLIERWTDKGWLPVDDYTDDVLAFASEVAFKKRLLDYAHAFIMGIPLSIVDSGYIPDYTTVTSVIKKPKKIFDIKPKNNKKEKNIKEKIDNYDSGSSKKDNDDDDDLDWL